MYDKLARGYATAYIQSIEDHGSLMGWADSSRRELSSESFAQSSLSKKPGRVLKRLSPFVRPPFSRLFIPKWDKQFKSASAHLITAAPETEVFDILEVNQPLYQERAVFLTNLIFSSEGGRCETSILTTANMSHHTLTRLLERDLATPDTLAEHVGQILQITRDFAQLFDQTSLDQEKTYSFLIPYREGALPAVTMRVQPTVKDLYQGNLSVLSLRTYLDGDKLTEVDRERMGGFKTSKISSYEDFSYNKRWMEGNARPFTLMAAAADEARRK